MRTRLSFVPFAAFALAACQATTPQADNGQDLNTEREGLFTSGVATTPAPAEDGSPVFALAANVRAQDDETTEEVVEEIDGAEAIAIRDQRMRTLSQKYTELAQEALDRGDLKGALGQFSDALDLDPANQAAREGFRRAEALLGDPLSGADVRFGDDVSALRIKEQMVRMRAQDFLSSGDVALKDGDFDGAVLAYRQAQTILEYNPLIANGSLDERVVTARLDEAIKLRDENAALELERKRAEAAAEIERRELDAKNQLFSKLEQYYKNADAAFRAERYDEAAYQAGLILERDPGNELATRMVEVAREAGHAKSSERIRRDYREEWLRTFDDLQTQDVPQIDTLKFDKDRWKIAEGRKSLSDLQIESAADPVAEQVMKALSSTTVPVDFEEAELQSVIDYLSAQTKVNFQLSALAASDIEDTVSYSLSDERSVKTVLDLITDNIEGLSWKVDNGVVLLITDDEKTGGQVNATYSVADLVTPIQDFVAPDINVEPSSGLDPVDEDLPERAANVIESGQLEELIQAAVAPNSWDEDPNNSIRVTERGTLVVRQTPEVQREIVQLLDDLRESTGILVDIETQFMRVEDNFLEDIGVDFRGLGLPGLGPNGFEFNDFGDGSSEFGDVIGRTSDIGAFFDDGADGNYRARIEDLYDSQLGSDSFKASGGLSFQWAFLNDLQLQMILRAVSKSERIETVTTPRLTVNNGARANLAVLNQVAYVQDFDVQIAQAASIADPIIKVIQDGVILDVRPVVSADRRFITLELRPTIAQLQRPIFEQPTTLGTQNSVTIQLPEVEIQRVRTSIPIPDGSTVLLGGLKESTKQDLRSGVPILNKIPLLNFFFERKGNFISNRKLLILLTADIVIPYENVPTAAELGRDL